MLVASLQGFLPNAFGIPAALREFSS